MISRHCRRELFCAVYVLLCMLCCPNCVNLLCYLSCAICTVHVVCVIATRPLLFLFCHFCFASLFCCLLCKSWCTRLLKSKGCVHRARHLWTSKSGCLSQDNVMPSFLLLASSSSKVDGVIIARTIRFGLTMQKSIEITGVILVHKMCMT